MKEFFYYFSFILFEIKNDKNVNNKQIQNIHITSDASYLHMSQPYRYEPKANCLLDMD